MVKIVMKTKIGCIFILLFSICAIASAGQKSREHEKTISPFGRHEDRYRQLYDSLLEKGVEPERIRTIFSSDKAKKIDMTPVERMAERVISPYRWRKRSRAELMAVAERIVGHLRRYEKEYDALEERYRVNREIGAAILYKETALGEFDNWRHHAFPVLNSILGFMEMPEDEAKKKRIERIVGTAGKSLEGLILYCERNGIDILKRDFPSSFAGAIGIPQFMPMYMDYAVPAGSTVPDLSIMADAILSLGNIFEKKFNWPGYMDLSRLEKIDEIREAYAVFDEQKGVSFCMSKHLDGYPLRPFVNSSYRFPHLEYIGGYCKSIMQYNFSSAYTLDVFQFAYYAHRIRSFSE